jgi:hypothetical protein
MTALIWGWYLATWVLILAVLLKGWRRRERRDQAETDRQLARTKPYLGDDHWGDA